MLYVVLHLQNIASPLPYFHSYQVVKTEEYL